MKSHKYGIRNWARLEPTDYIGQWQGVKNNIQARRFQSINIDTQTEEAQCRV
jgi:hypothetical protein